LPKEVGWLGHKGVSQQGQGQGLPISTKNTNIPEPSSETRRDLPSPSVLRH
jgi:hypothetical protein